MDRRKFLGSLVGGVATAAAVRTWPFRVFSFPSEPRILTIEEMYKRGVMGSSVGFDWYISAELPVILVDNECLVTDSWDPQKGKMIVHRGIASYWAAKLEQDRNA